MFIHWAIKHYDELWRVENRTQSGRLKSLRAEATIKTMWEQIRQNLLWKLKIMSQELNMSAKTMSCIIRDDPHMRWKGHLRTPTLKGIRWTSAESPPVAR
jgi:hypothetical protein